MELGAISQPAGLCSNRPSKQGLLSRPFWNRTSALSPLTEAINISFKSLCYIVTQAYFADKSSFVHFTRIAVS